MKHLQVHMFYQLLWINITKNNYSNVTVTINTHQHQNYRSFTSPFHVVLLIVQKREKFSVFSQSTQVFVNNFELHLVFEESKLLDKGIHTLHQNSTPRSCGRITQESRLRFETFIEFVQVIRAHRILIFSKNNVPVHINISVFGM